MKTKPILFTGPMVRAILDGRKTQTRRVVKPQPGDQPNDSGFRSDILDDRCPYEPMDLLWVRETFAYVNWAEDGEPQIKYKADGSTRWVDYYEYDDAWGEKLSDIHAYLSRDENFKIDGVASDRKWRPSIFMPRWASRIDLMVNNARVERVQDISESDAEAEGCHGEMNNIGHGCVGEIAPSEQFRDLWNNINGKKPGCSWEDNPWVWVIEFERIKP